MTGLMQEISERALKLGVPLSVQLDLTYRCNERCVHCYLDHEDHGEMTTAEIKNLLDQLAEAGVLFLTLSGGEIMLRKDFFDSACPEVHDTITKVRGSLQRSVNAIRFLKSQGLNVTIANALMLQNIRDYPGVKALGEELGVGVTMDPTITPKMDGDRSLLALGLNHSELVKVFRDESLIGNLEEFCAPPPKVTEDDLDSLPCSAGHTACYVSPYGEVYPCVQFPLPTGNVRKSKFLDIWHHSPRFNEVRSIKLRDMPACAQCSHGGTCTRCPGLAYMEGNMRGPSSQDCEKSFARTGIPSASLLSRKPSLPGLVQIQRPPTGPLVR